MRVSQDNMSVEACAIMSAAARGNGRVSYSANMRGFRLVAGAKTLIEQQREPRAEAKWCSALEELVSGGFLQPQGQAYLVTRLGFEWVDACC